MSWLAMIGRTRPGMALDEVLGDLGIIAQRINQHHPGCTISLECAVVSSVLTGMMFGIGAHDSIAFVFVPSLLLGIAAIATLLPARRAMEVDPVIAILQ